MGLGPAEHRCKMMLARSSNFQVVDAEMFRFRTYFTSTIGACSLGTAMLSMSSVVRLWAYGCRPQGQHHQENVGGARP